MICGWGSEARVFASIAASVNRTEVRVLPDRLNMPTNDFRVTFRRNGEEPTHITCRPPVISHNPEDAMKDVDIVVFMLPAHANEDFLHDLRPYIEPGVIIVGLPGGPGFELQVREALGDVMQQCTIMNFDSSPWVCNELGVDCEVISTEEVLLGTVMVSLKHFISVGIHVWRRISMKFLSSYRNTTVLKQFFQLNDHCFPKIYIFS